MSFLNTKLKLCSCGDLIADALLEPLSTDAATTGPEMERPWPPLSPVASKHGLVIKTDGRGRNGSDFALLPRNTR